VKKYVDPISYKLKLPLFMRRLYLVFNIIKLTTTTEDPILDSQALFLPNYVIIDSEEECQVKIVLDSY